MTPSAVKKSFKSFLKEKGISEKSLTPEIGFAVMCDFYLSVKFDWALPEEDDGDMLLFQYGTHDWGDGENFELNLTRQVIKSNGDDEDDEDDESLIQLALTFVYPSAKVGRIKSFNQWCREAEELGALLQAIKVSKGFIAASKVTPVKIKIESQLAG